MDIVNLGDIEGLSTGAEELLSAVGVEDLASLARSDASRLCAEMANANQHLGLEQSVPSEHEVESWIRTVQGDSAEAPAVEEVTAPAPASDPSKVSRSEPLPIAIEVQKEQIMKNKIAVADVPVMENFVEFEEPRKPSAPKRAVQNTASSEPRATADGKEVRKKKSVRKKRRKPQPQPQPERPAATRQETRQMVARGIPSLKSDPLARNDRPVDEPKRVVEPLKRNASLDIRKTVSADLNQGRKLHSRRFIRGVLHPQPARVRVAAFVSILTVFLIPVSIISVALILLKDYLPIDNLLWFLVAPACLLFFGFLYLTIAKPMKCRICGQPLLSRKACFKHVKAHRIRVLGYILPTGLHMLLFHWFRCIYCGTSVRLKE